MYYYLFHLLQVYFWLGCFLLQGMVWYKVMVWEGKSASGEI